MREIPFSTRTAPLRRDEMSGTSFDCDSIAADPMALVHDQTCSTQHPCAKYPLQKATQYQRTCKLIGTKLWFAHRCRKDYHYKCVMKTYHRVLPSAMPGAHRTSLRRLVILFSRNTELALVSESTTRPLCLPACLCLPPSLHASIHSSVAHSYSHSAVAKR